MEINYFLVLVASVVQFILGALWYSPLMFGNWWMQIMGMDCNNLSKEELQKMQKEMMPFYGLQFVLTILTTFVFANALAIDPFKAPFVLAFWIWLGYVMPTQIASVIWGNTKKEMWPKQMFVMVSYQFVAIMLAAWILTM